MSEGQTWNSEDTRLYSFTVFFGPWQAVVMEAGYTSKAPMCAGRLEALTHFRQRRISLRLRLRSLWKVCSSLLAATATAEFELKGKPS
jgi:hypothetical protein